MTMRYRLRTLLIVLAFGPPLMSLLGWAIGKSPVGNDYRTARSAVELRRLEWDVAKFRSGKNRRNEAAAERHAKLQYRSEDAIARQRSVLYRFLEPAP